MRVLGFLDAVELQAGRGRIKLQIERRILHRFLVLRRQAGQSVDEAVGDTEIHHFFLFLFANLSSYRAQIIVG